MPSAYLHRRDLPCDFLHGCESRSRGGLYVYARVDQAEVSRLDCALPRLSCQIVMVKAEVLQMTVVVQHRYHCGLCEKAQASSLLILSHPRCLLLNLFLTLHHLQ